MSRLGRDKTLQNNGGIVVNGLFEAVNGVYAAGGAASFFDLNLGRGRGRRRIASHDHCVNSGLFAGERFLYSQCVLLGVCRSAAVVPAFPLAGILGPKTLPLARGLFSCSEGRGGCLLVCSNSLRWPSMGQGCYRSSCTCERRIT